MPRRGSARWASERAAWEGPQAHHPADRARPITPFTIAGLRPTARAAPSKQTREVGRSVHVVRTRVDSGCAGRHRLARRGSISAHQECGDRLGPDERRRERARGPSVVGSFAGRVNERSGGGSRRRSARWAGERAVGSGLGPAVVGPLAGRVNERSGAGSGPLRRRSVRWASERAVGSGLRRRSVRWAGERAVGSGLGPLRRRFVRWAGERAVGSGSGPSVVGSFAGRVNERSGGPGSVVGSFAGRVNERSRAGSGLRRRFVRWAAERRSVAGSERSGTSGARHRQQRLAAPSGRGRRLGRSRAGQPDDHGRARDGERDGGEEGHEDDAVDRACGESRRVRARS